MVSRSIISSAEEGSAATFEQPALSQIVSKPANGVRTSPVADDPGDDDAVAIGVPRAATRPRGRALGVEDPLAHDPRRASDRHPVTWC
jgi:hypothetical protein